MGFRKTSLLWGVPFVLGALGQVGFSTHAWGAKNEEGAGGESAGEKAGAFSTQAAAGAYPPAQVEAYERWQENRRAFRWDLRQARDALRDLDFDIKNASGLEKEFLLDALSSKTYRDFRGIVSGAAAKERAFQEQQNAILKNIFGEAGEEEDVLVFWDKKAQELEEALGL